MENCEECGKGLGVLQGYYHPALGSKFLVCRICFDNVEKSMKRWSDFCLSNSFNVKSSKLIIQEAWNNSISNDLKLQRWFSNLWSKKGF